MTANDTVREFLGLPVKGERQGNSRREYTPRPIEELYPYFKEAFAKGITALTWHQYTPYFNDGEPCEFSVYDLSMTTNEEVAQNWLNDDFYEDRMVEVSEEVYKKETEDATYYTGYYEEDGKYFRRYEEGAYDYSHPYSFSSHPDGLKGEDFNVPINDLEFEDALRTVFGDHTQVVVTPTAVVQYSYEHE